MTTGKELSCKKHKYTKDEFLKMRYDISCYALGENITDPYELSRLTGYSLDGVYKVLNNLKRTGSL